MINLRGYCSDSTTGLKSMATARVVLDPESTSHLNQREAAGIDKILMDVDINVSYKPVNCYPKRTAKPLYTGLITQLESLSIPFLSVEDLPVDLSTSYDVIVDSIFGFSFHGSPRLPFDGLIQTMVDLGNLNQKQQKSPAIVSVDIPSGWHVEEGDLSGEGI